MGCNFALLGLACVGRDPEAFQAIRPLNHWGKTLCEIDSGIWVEYVNCILCGKFAHACSMNTYTYSIASLPGPWLAFHHLQYGTTFVQNVWNEAIFMYFTMYVLHNQIRVQSQKEVADIVTMDPLWIEFRSSPSAYLSSRKMDVDVFVNDVLQVSLVPRLAWPKTHSSRCSC